MAMNENINKANALSVVVSKWNRFRNCNAYVSGVVEGRYQLIKSYRTIVAMVDNATSTVYEFGKYSQTTSKQITQIINSMFRGYVREFIDETNW